MLGTSGLRTIGRNPLGQDSTVELAEPTGRMAFGRPMGGVMPHSDRPQRPRLYRPRVVIDPDRLRLPKERDLAAEIERCPQVRERLQLRAEEARDLQWADRRRHLASSLRVTPRISKRLHTALKTVCTILPIDVDAELYVEQSAEIGASCAAMPHGAVLVTITSAAVEKLDSAELLFVLGHEIGHYVLGHHRWCVGWLLAPPRESERIEPLAAASALRLLAWSRYYEVSADRMGILCAQSDRSMASAFLKLASGLPGSFLGTGEDYLLQLEEWIQERDEHDGWTCTHPLHGIRIHAGRSFWRSDYVREILGVEVQERLLTCSEADEEAESRLAAMDPARDAVGGTDEASVVAEFLAYAGVLVLAADGEVHPAELTRAVVVADAAAVGEAMIVMSEGGVDGLSKEIGRLSVSVLDRVSDEAQYQLLVQLVVIAYVDGEITREELVVLRAIARVLQFNPTTIDLMIGQLEAGEWE